VSAQDLFAVGVNPTTGGFTGSIDEFAPNGVRNTFGSGLTSPFALAFDSGGNLFVADAGNENAGSGAVYKFTPAGARTTFALGLSVPVGLAFDSAGNLFATEFYSGLIYKITPNGVRSTFASGLGEPQGLAFDSAGDLFVATSGEGTVYKFTPTGVRSTFASGLTWPFALAFDSGGNLFVADGGDPWDYPPLDGAVYKFTPTGLRSILASGLTYPNGLAIDSADNLFVAESHWEQRTLVGSILKVTPSGGRTTFATRTVGAMAFQPPQTSAPTLVNISARGFVETGENVLISGFIVTGGDSEPVVIRALGPTLTSFGVTDTLQDPVLALHDSTSMIALNDDWQSAANASQIQVNYRPADVRESAIMTTLSPGAYTAVLSGKNATTGNGLLEVYSTLSVLSNVSTRGFVGTGDHVLIGGFSSSGGNGSLQVVIRALGPTLTQFGVSGALADPTLIVVNGNGSVIASNDNWKNTQREVIQTTGFAPPNDLESAIFAALPNGNYTAILAGKNGETGVGLLDVYKVAVATNQ
jgi:sugar lactone lactonase YvrE